MTELPRPVGEQFAEPPGCGWGLHDRLPFRDYLGWKAASKHGLDLVNRSPSHWLSEHQFPIEATPAMILGQLVHEAVLEPEKLRSWVVQPKFDRRTKAGKEAYAEWVEQLDPDATLVTDTQMKTCADMVDAVHSHTAAQAMLAEDVEGRQAELSGVYPEPRYTIGGKPIAVKFRADLFLPNQGLIVDLKTTHDARPMSFAKDIANLRYHVQAALYLDGMEMLRPSNGRQFAFIAVEKKPPYEVGVYYLEAEDVLRGRSAYLRDLRQFAVCLENDSYPGYGNLAKALPLPKWARVQHDERFEYGE